VNKKGTKPSRGSSRKKCNSDIIGKRAQWTSGGIKLPKAERGEVNSQRRGHIINGIKVRGGKTMGGEMHRDKGKK